MTWGWRTERKMDGAAKSLLWRTPRQLASPTYWDYVMNSWGPSSWRTSKAPDRRLSSASSATPRTQRLPQNCLKFAGYPILIPSPSSSSPGVRIGRPSNGQRRGGTMSQPASAETRTAFNPARIRGIHAYNVTVQCGSACNHGACHSICNT